jgi:antitoxin MazE
MPPGIPPVNAQYRFEARFDTRATHGPNVIYTRFVYIHSAQEFIMQVAKWGNSLAVRLPASVVEALSLKEGDDIDIQIAGTHAFEIEKKPGTAELLNRLRQFRGRLPADFKFDRLAAHERD